jgi:hypothetical protein
VASNSANERSKRGQGSVAILGRPAQVEGLGDQILWLEGRRERIVRHDRPCDGSAVYRTSQENEFIIGSPAHRSTVTLGKKDGNRAKLFGPKGWPAGMRGWPGYQEYEPESRKLTERLVLVEVEGTAFIQIVTCSMWLSGHAPEWW